MSRVIARLRRASEIRSMPMTDAALATPEVSASDTIRTTGILHFTIGVRDHIAAAKFYSDVLGCKHMRSDHAILSWNAAAAISCWRKCPIM